MQRILGKGVGLDVVCPRSACDIDGSGLISAPDAQRGLALAVGLEAEEECSLGGTDITFFVRSDESLGSLQFNAHYGLTGCFFVGSADNVECVSLVPNAIVTFNNEEREKVLRVGIISLSAFVGPISVARCRFNNPIDAPRPEFIMELVDAADEHFLHQVPELGYHVSGEPCEVDCGVFTCGNGVIEGREECDDGNDSNEDACKNTCKRAFCGDGFVEHGVEDCDNGIDNGHSSGCTNACHFRGCGDGVVDAGEDCDDGNGSNADFCLNDCSIAFCGDGFVNPATEQCDPEDAYSDASCESDCHETDGCEDDGSDCAIGGDWIVFSVRGTGALGALQFNADYSDSGVRFFGRDDGVKCVSLLGAGISTFNDDQDVRTLRTGFISLQGFSTPRDVSACRIEIAKSAPVPDFDITVVDASDPVLSPVAPLPIVRYRLYRSD